MKTKVDAKAFKSAIKAAQTLQNLAPGIKMPDEETGGFKGCITVVEGGILVHTGVMGAYVQLHVPATTLKKGAVGVDLNTVDKLRLSGTLKIQQDPTDQTVEFIAGKTSYKVPLDQDIIHLIKDAKPTDIEAPIVAKIPTKVLANATAMVAVKPTIKAEDMRIQFTLKPGFMELVGLDNFCYARCITKNDTVKVKGEHRFILRSTSISTILSTIKGEVISIGVAYPEGSKVPNIIRFKAQDADVYYPTLDSPFVDPGVVKASVTEGTLDCGFTTLKKNVKDAITNVKIVSPGANVPIVLFIRVNGTSVKIASRYGASSAVDDVASSDVRVTGNDPFMMKVSCHYLESFINLVPAVVPLRFESWDKKSILIQADAKSIGTVEYFVNQVDMENLQDN